MLERMIQEKAQLEGRLEEMAIDLETSKLELEATKEQAVDQKRKEQEERQKKEAELTADSSSNASVEVYKEKVIQMRLALEKITNLYESEKKTSGKYALELEEHVKKEQELVEKLKDMDVLFETVDVKENEIEELKLKLDEAHGFESMVEKLTEESLAKDEELERIAGKYKEKTEELRTEEEINDLLEDEKKELGAQLGTKDYELTAQKQVQQTLEHKINDLEMTIKQYQERMSQYREEVGMLEGHVKSSGQEEKLKRIEELLSKQARLTTMLREARKFEINSILAQHNLSSVQLRLSLCEAILPAKLNEIVNMPGYDKAALVYMSRARCDSALHLLKEKYLIDDEGTEINVAFLTYVTDLLIKLSNVAIALDKIMYYLTKCPVEQYDKLTKDQTKWNQLLVVSSFIGQIMELVKDELLSPQVSLDSFRISANAVIDLAAELKTAISGSQSATKAEAAEPSDKFLAVQCLYRIDVPICVFYYIYTKNHAGTALQVEKAAKVHRNIRRCVGLLRKVRANEDGSKYLRHWQLMEESFEQKYKYAECLWTKTKDAYASNDWNSWLEAVDAQMLGMYGHSNFKELEAEGIEEKLQEVAGYGPWGEKTKDVNKELSEAADMKQEIEKRQDALKAGKLEYLKLENELKEYKVLKSTLERRLGENQQKIERIGQLEIEKRRLVEKEKSYHDSIENLKAECDQQALKCKEYADKVAALEAQVNDASAGKSRKASSLRQNTEMRRGSVRPGADLGLGKSGFVVQGGNYYLNIIRRLLVFSRIIRYLNRRRRNRSRAS